MRRLRTLHLETGMPTLVIPVSSKIIAEAVKRDSHHCMFADAIKKRIPKAQFISVDLQSIRFTDPDTKTRYKYFTPVPAQVALVKFDQGDSVRPLTITLKDGVKESVEKESLLRRRRKARAVPSPARKPRAAAAKKPRLATKERKFGLRNLH
jgi:hypothetical protein